MYLEGNECYEQQPPRQIIAHAKSVTYTDLKD